MDREYGEVWLSHQQLAQLFGRDVKTIGKHVGNALREELAGSKAPTVAKFATVQREGDREVTRQVEHYSLDVALSVGYRVKSRRGVEFRRWASGVLRSYIVEGRAENARRLEQLAQVAAVMARIPESLETRQVLDIVQGYGWRDRRPLQVGAVYSKLSNLVIGFHGCERAVFDAGYPVP